MLTSLLFLFDSVFTESGFWLILPITFDIVILGIGYVVYYD